MGTRTEAAHLEVTGPISGAPVRLLAVLLAYLATGEVARLLAIPPGYASPVWPPAGIAVAAAVLAGRAGVAGVALGSFVLNLHIGLRTDAPFFPTGLAIAVAIAVGAAAQAHGAAWLTRRFLGPGNPMERGYSVPAFILLAGPIASLVNGLWAPAWLWVLGQIPGHELAADAMTWWVGDSIGVMLVAPLLLAVRAPGYFETPRQTVGLLIPLVVGTTGVVLLFVQAQGAVKLGQEAAFSDRARLLAGAITQDLDRAAAFTESTARAFGALAEIDREGFRVLVTPWLDANPAIEAFEWMPYVPEAERAAFEARARDAAFPDYRIRERVLAVEPPSGADFHAPILYVEPLTDEHGAVGYDLASSPSRLRALEAARDTGVTTATGGVRLVLYPGEWGMLLIAAAYGGVTPPVTIEARRAELRGFAATVLRFDELARQALARRGEHRDLRVRVHELVDGKPRLLTGPPDAEVHPGAATWSRWSTVGGQRLRIQIVTAGPVQRPWTGWTVLALGLAGTGVLVAFVLDLRSQSLRVERLVAERTADLARANEALTLSNLELQRFAYVASHDLREPLRTITAYSELLEKDAGTLDPASQGYLKRIVAATRRMQALVGELLAFTRVDRRVEPYRDVPLDRSVQAALEDLAATIAETGAVVRVGPLPVVHADPIQMVQLFSNLLSNALKFRRPEVPLEIHIASTETPKTWEVTVRDNGIGIDARHFDRVFEIFQKLNADVAYPGQGVGLATCRRIMDRHCGRIWVESTPDQGSVFHLSFPRMP